MKTVFVFTILSLLSFQAYAKTDCRVTLRLDSSHMFDSTFENVGDSFVLQRNSYLFEYAYSDATKLNKLKITNLSDQKVRETESADSVQTLIFDYADYNAARIECRRFDSESGPVGPIELPEIFD